MKFSPSIPFSTSFSSLNYSNFVALFDHSPLHSLTHPLLSSDSNFILSLNNFFHIQQSQNLKFSNFVTLYRFTFKHATIFSPCSHFAPARPSLLLVLLAVSPPAPPFLLHFQPLPSSSSFQPGNCPIRLLAAAAPPDAIICLRSLVSPCSLAHSNAFIMSARSPFALSLDISDRAGSGKEWRQDGCPWGRVEGISS